jgi:hypothetical protein
MTNPRPCWRVFSTIFFSRMRSRASPIFRETPTWSTWGISTRKRPAIVT